jgi:phthiodiolone/phenolphthiodiolone dimycocerosates ketoreductase
VGTSVTGFQVGLADVILHSRYGAAALPSANYIAAAIAGVDSFWVADHLNALLPQSIATPQYRGSAKVAPDVDANLEPWTTLGYLAARNRPRRLRLGIGVTDAGRRNPAVTAQAAATLHLLTRGRAILGIGVGEREGNEPYGVDWAKPVARFEEALATIRVLWNSRGELVSRDSPYFPLRNAVFRLPPYRGSWPPIWIAAHGPRMLRATGRYGDAWCPVAFFGPEEYAQRLDAVLSAASDAGRDPSVITPAALMYVITGRSPDDVEEAIGSDIAKSFALNAPGELWARHGAAHPFGADFSGLQDLIPQLIDEPTALSYTAQVPPALMREIVLAGTPQQIIDQVASWPNHGLRYLVLCNLSPLQPSLRRGISASAPFIKILRELKKL